MLLGLHCPNGPLSNDTLTVFQEGGILAAKLMPYHRVEDARRLQAVGVSQFLIRSPDTRHPDGTYFDAYEFAQECAGILNPFLWSGIPIQLQVANEPQYEWAQKGYGPYEFVYWMRRVVAFLRGTLGSGVQLVSPPLSWGPALWQKTPANPLYTLDDWIEAYTWTNDGQLPCILSLFDAVGANVYWQYEKQIADPSFGRSYRTVHEHSRCGSCQCGLPVVVTEWGCSLGDVSTDAAPTPEELHAAMMAQYPVWIRDAAAAGYVDAAYCFIAPLSQGWSQFEIDQDISREMKQALEPVPETAAIAGSGTPGGRGPVAL